MAVATCNPLMNDVGYVPGEASRTIAAATGSYIRQAAAALIAIDNANRLVKNYKKQRDIQDRMLKIAEDQQNHLETVFWPREIQFLNEFSVPEAVEAVEVMGRRYGGRLVAVIAAGFAQKLKEAKCNSPRYCTSSSTKALQDLMMARSLAMANARVLGRNIAFAEFQARNDVNLERRMQAVAIGRDLMQQAAALYESAGKGLAAAGGILSDQLSSAMEKFGYERNFREDLRRQAYEEVGKRPNTGASAPKTDATGRPLGTDLQQTFGYESSTRGTFTNEASNTFRADGKYGEAKLADANYHLLTNHDPDAMNIGGP